MRFDELKRPDVITVDFIREALALYTNPSPEVAAEIECILSEPYITSILDGLAEKYAGQAADDAQRREAFPYAVSVLWETHGGGIHQPTCPHFDPAVPFGRCEHEWVWRGNQGELCWSVLTSPTECPNAGEHITHEELVHREDAAYAEIRTRHRT